MIDRAAFTPVEETKQSNDECDQSSCSGAAYINNINGDINDEEDNNDGEVGTRRSNFFVWGNNSYGQLALGEEMQTVVDPVAIRLPTSIKKIKSVACGGSHTLILSQSGSVFAMGDNSFGQLGLSTMQKSSSY